MRRYVKITFKILNYIRFTENNAKCIVIFYAKNKTKQTKNACLACRFFFFLFPYKHNEVIVYLSKKESDGNILSVHLCGKTLDSRFTLYP